MRALAPILLGIALWTAGPAAAARPAGQPAEAAASAQLRQTLLPELDRREASARARLSAARDYFAGKIALEAAFPDLVGAPLGDGAFLGGLSERLRQQATARAAERVAEAPAELAEREVALWRARTEASCDAEDAADQQLQRLIAALTAGSARAPDLADAAVAPVRAEWSALRASAQGADPDTPEGAAALALALAAGEAEASLERTRREARRAMTIPGDPGLARAAEADLAILTASTEGAAGVEPPAMLARRAAIDRLRRGLPLLGGALAERTRQTLDDIEEEALQTELAALAARSAEALPAPTGDRADLEQRLSRLEAEVASLREARDALPTDGEGELAALRRGVAEARLKEAMRRQRAASDAIEALRRLDAAETAETADAARERADAARREAERQAGAMEKALHGQIADMREREAAVRTAEVQRLQTERAAYADLETRVASENDALNTALALPPLAKQRQEAFDEAFLDSWTLIGDIRRAEARASAEIGRLGTDNDTIASGLGAPMGTTGAGSAEMAKLLAEQEAARKDLTKALDQRLQDARDTRESLARLLERAKKVRRRARPYASATARLTIQRNFVSDLAAEAAEAPMRLRLYVRDLTAAILGLPAAMLDLSKLVAFLRASFGLVFVIGLWWVGRSQAEAMATAAADALSERRRAPANVVEHIAELVRERLVPGPPHSAVPRVTELTIKALDLLAAAIVLPFLGADLDLTVLLVWISVAWLSFRVVKPLVAVVLVQEGLPGPALLSASRHTIELTRRSLRTMVAWWFWWHIARVFALSVLDADRIADLIALGRFISLIVIALTLLGSWSGHIRAAVAAEEPSSRPLKWAVSVEAGPARMVAAALGLGWLIGRWGQDTLLPMLSSTRWFSWLDALRTASVLSESEQPRAPLPVSVRTRIEGAYVPIEALEQAVAEVAEEFSGWFDDTRRGIVAISSAGSFGRKQLFDGLVATLAARAVPIKRIEVPVLRDPTAARRWLAAQLQLDEAAAASVDTLARTIERLPKSVFLVDYAHNAMLRAVNGFAPLRDLLDVMHQSSEEHFWVIGLHGAAWDYLSHVPEAVDMNTVRNHVRMPRLGPADLETWLGALARGAGVELEFDRLARIDETITGRERARRLERARRAYWRMLSQVSDGDAKVARTLWLEQLCGGSAPGKASVGAPEAPPEDKLTALDDNALFTLTALHVHFELTIPDIARSLNLDATAIATVCRHLESEGIVVSPDDRTFRIAGAWRAAVARRLSLRHLFHIRS